MAMSQRGLTLSPVLAWARSDAAEPAAPRSQGRGADDNGGGGVSTRAVHCRARAAHLEGSSPRHLLLRTESERGFHLKGSRSSSAASFPAGTKLKRTPREARFQTCEMEWNMRTALAADLAETRQCVFSIRERRRQDLFAQQHGNEIGRRSKMESWLRTNEEALFAQQHGNQLGRRSKMESWLRTDEEASVLFSTLV